MALDMLDVATLLAAETRVDGQRLRGG